MAAIEKPDFSHRRQPELLIDNSLDPLDRT